MEIKKESNDYIIKFNNHKVLVFLNGLLSSLKIMKLLMKLSKKYYMTYKDLIHIAKKSIINN